MTVSVPATLKELQSPAWLTSALSQRYPGIEVTAVVTGPVISRVATNARFRVECAGGQPDGLSANLCGKGYFTEVGWGARTAGVPEAYFYRDIAAYTGLRTLRSVYADVDPTTLHGVIITEDVVVEGAEFLDALSDYTPDQAAESLEELAKLHAATRGRPQFAEVPWLAPRLETYLQGRGINEIRGNFEGPIGAGVPEKTRDAQRLVDAYRALAVEVAANTDWSLIHGDAHIGNVYLDGAGRPSFVDWQLVQRAPWYLDVGYHIASALTVADRRLHEETLLRHYLECVAAAGADAPTYDEAWAGVRRGILHGFYLWGITLKVDPAITTTLLDRLGTAAADHDALGAVGV
jgi:hypothetical protein